MTGYHVAALWRRRWRRRRRTFGCAETHVIRSCRIDPSAISSAKYIFHATCTDKEAVATAETVTVYIHNTVNRLVGPTFIVKRVLTSDY